MLLSNEEDEILLKYAEELGCNIYKNVTIDTYHNDAINFNKFDNGWCIVLNSTVILMRPAKNTIYSIYYRSSILNTKEHNGPKYRYRTNNINIIPMEKYNGATLEKMKKYIKHQVENIEKIKQREIKKKLKNIEKDFDND